MFLEVFLRVFLEFFLKVFLEVFLKVFLEQCVTNMIFWIKYECKYIWVEIFWRIQLQIYLD